MFSGCFLRYDIRNAAGRISRPYESTFSTKLRMVAEVWSLLLAITLWPLPLAALPPLSPPRLPAATSSVAMANKTITAIDLNSSDDGTETPHSIILSVVCVCCFQYAQVRKGVCKCEFGRERESARAS